MILSIQEQIYIDYDLIFKMDRNTIQKILIGIILAACVFIGLKSFNVIDIDNTQSRPDGTNNIRSSRMTYGRWLEYLEMGWVKQVD